MTKVNLKIGRILHLSKSKQGQALIIALSVMGVLGLTATLMMGKYFQSAKQVRTSGSKVEANALFRQIEQSVSNLTICSSAFQAYSFQNAQTGHVPTAVDTPNLNAVINGTATPIAFPGMVSNGVSLAANQPMQLTGGPNYTNYGTQITGLTAYQGLNCALVNLHVNASKEPLNVTSDKRHTLGLQTIGEDFPLTIFTDPVTDQIKSCFGGAPLPGACIQAAPATINTLTPATQCVTPGPVNFSWTATGASYVQINCTSPSVLSGNLTASPSTVDMTGVPAGTIETCTATAYNSAFVPSTTSIPVTVYVEATCVPPVVTISRSVACVNPGKPYTISWTDNDPEPTGVETLVGPAVPGPFTPPVTPGGSITPLAPATSPLNYGITDTNFAGTGSATTSLVVIPPPSFTTVLNSSSSPVFSGGNIVFNYHTLNATGVSYVDPVTSAPISEAIQGPVTVVAPIAGGSYAYSYTLAGGCPGDPPVTDSVSITVCQCVLANVLTTPVGLPSLDSCGISRIQCPGTKPPCKCILANQNTAPVTQLATIDSCSVLNASCPGLKPCTCIAANEAATPTGQPTIDSCGALNASCPGTKASCSCIAANEATTASGQPSIDSCGVLDPACPGIKVSSCVHGSICSCGPPDASIVTLTKDPVTGYNATSAIYADSCGNLNCQFSEDNAQNYRAGHNRSTCINLGVPFKNRIGTDASGNFGACYDNQCYIGNRLGTPRRTADCGYTGVMTECGCFGGAAPLVPATCP